MPQEIPLFIGASVLTVFCVGYFFVFLEERIHLRKSIPVTVAAGVIWSLVAFSLSQNGQSSEIGGKARTVLLEFAELFLFLLSAMSFVNSMVERNVFEALRTKLTASKLSERGIFWITGLSAFFLSPIADNLTTALVMGTVVLSALGHNKKAAAAGLVNVVVAANAGGAFSPFGDITTLMVWQKKCLEFSEFFRLFLPALVNWLVPAAIMSFSVSTKKTESVKEAFEIKKGGYVIVAMFLCTIALTVWMDHALHLPPFMGMMIGLGALNLYGYFLNMTETRTARTTVRPSSAMSKNEIWGLRKPFDIFGILEKVEWDTLLFFYGIMFGIGGLAAIGYMDAASNFLYDEFGHTMANISVGIFSAVVGAIPVTFAVLTMYPDMDAFQWLLVTFTAGVGGSLLSIGSAAGVALMGIGRGTYTFASHLKWSWAIFLGFVAGIAAHALLNG